MMFFFLFLICPGLYESELFNERATRGPGFKSSQFLRNWTKQIHVVACPMPSWVQMLQQADLTQ